MDFKNVLHHNKLIFEFHFSTSLLSLLRCSPWRPRHAFLSQTELCLLSSPKSTCCYRNFFWWWSLPAQVLISMMMLSENIYTTISHNHQEIKMLTGIAMIRLLLWRYYEEMQARENKVFLERCSEILLCWQTVLVEWLQVGLQFLPVKSVYPRWDPQSEVNYQVIGPISVK